MDSSMPPVRTVALPITRSPLRVALIASRPYWKPASVATVGVTLAGILAAFIPYTYKLIIDAVGKLGTVGTGPVWHATALYIGVSFLSTMLWRASGFAGMYWSTGMRSTVNEALSSHVTLHSHHYFTERMAGTLAAKISRAADGIDGLCQAFLYQYLRFAVTLISSVIIVFSTSLLIGAIYLALLLVMTPLNIYLARRRVPLSAFANERELMFGGTILDVLANISTVHEYMRNRHELGHLTDLLRERREASIRSWRYHERVLLANGVLQTLAIGGMLVVSVYLALRGRMSAGDVILVLTMTGLIQDQLTFIGTQLNALADNWGQITSSLADILVPHEIVDANEAPPLSVTAGGIEFRNISFSYRGRDVFHDFSLSIPGGQRIGLVGRSGAGKSTLLKLLLRHYIIQHGTISIDGQDISGVSRESLREAIAIVPQEPSLFHRSVARNISYARPDAPLDEIYEAARRAQADEFIGEMPEGYDTIVGERGSKLSGGQRQRIAIARAILKNAPILLLDEATSALDSESEDAIQRALDDLMRDRTVLAIAHRLSTLRSMDRIVVLDAGKVIEYGTHSELLQQDGLYAKLWHNQAHGFLEKPLNRS